MNPKLQVIGRMVSSFIFISTLIVQVTPEQATANIDGLFGREVVRLLIEWYQFIGGFAFASMIVFWFGPMFLSNPDHPPQCPIAPTFLSLFGRYRLGPVNVYQPDGFGNAIGRTINLASERDKLVRVKRLIPGLLYRVELEDPTQLISVLIQRSPRDRHWRVIQFGLAG